MDQDEKAADARNGGRRETFMLDYGFSGSMPTKQNETLTFFFSSFHFF
jgi:hypothetical protein